MANHRGHKLLTKELLKLLPELGATDGKPDNERKVPVKFFSPYNGWKWYVLEYDPQDRMCFGLVNGFESEFGYFSLDELDTAMVRGIVPAVERDCSWNPNITLDQVKALRK